MTGADAGAVLLDLDGTLVDSRPGIVTAMNATLESLGERPRPAAELEANIGPPLHDTFGRLLGLADEDPELDAIVVAYRERYARGMLDGTTVYAGVPEALRELHAAGWTLAIATSKSQPLAIALAEGLGLAPFLSAVLGPEPPARDTKTQTVAKALDALGHPARAVMVGDRRHDVEGAHAHGLPAIGVLWGIGGREELEGAGAEALCRAPDDLPSAVRRLFA